MKCFMIMAFVASVMAQSSSTVSSSSTLTSSASSEEVTTVTEYYPDCSTLPVGNNSITATSTGTITETIPCHNCEATKGIYTTYTTVYEELCPTGLAPKTYTIVEQCPETDQPRPTNYVPQGFVVTTVACAPCMQETVVLTTPVAVATPPPAPVITAAVNTSTVCHTCNQTIMSVQFGQAASTSLGLSIVTLFSVFFGAFVLL